MYKFFIKRIFDIIGACAGLAFATPILIIFVILIKLETPGPVIFRQKRIGYKGRVFEIWKFRSMVQNAEHSGSGVYSDKNDSRVTRIGRLIRATSIDELPQLFNVLRGEMSFIGPRPPLTYHPWNFDKYTDKQKRMFDVRPGISGWAQVNGRKDVEWHKRIELNVWYVNNVSLLLDLKIMWLTMRKVVSNADNENTGVTVVKSVDIEKKEVTQ